MRVSLRVQFTNSWYCSYGCGCDSQILFVGAGASAVENQDCDVGTGAGAVENFELYM